MDDEHLDEQIAALEQALLDEYGIEDFQREMNARLCGQEAQQYAKKRIEGLGQLTMIIPAADYFRGIQTDPDFWKNKGDLAWYKRLAPDTVVK